jgi:formylglycine-generating enzyme required for sulfatase activity
MTFARSLADLGVVRGAWVAVAVAAWLGAGTGCSGPSENQGQALRIISRGLAGDRWLAPLPKSGSVAMRWVPATRFVMGSPPQEEGRLVDEPHHAVQLTSGFFIAETELTQRQWLAFMETNPSPVRGMDLPVSQVSWEQAREFCRRLTRQQSQEGHLPKGWIWDLPTEAQWELACRAGTPGAFSGDLDSLAWYAGNSGGVVHPVGLRAANGLGLKDMHGNVAEWCVDWFSSYPTNVPVIVDPTGPIWSFAPTYRGGGFKSPPSACRSAARSAGVPGEVPHEALGFRLALRYRRETL